LLAGEVGDKNVPVLCLQIVFELILEICPEAESSRPFPLQELFLVEHFGDEHKVVVGGGGVEEYLYRQAVVEVVVEQLASAQLHLQVLHSFHDSVEQRDLGVVLFQDETEDLRVWGIANEFYGHQTGFCEAWFFRIQRADFAHGL
jgi:hypothetical protein